MCYIIVAVGSVFFCAVGFGMYVVLYGFCCQCVFWLGSGVEFIAV